jgi:hypothetical protein
MSHAVSFVKLDIFVLWHFVRLNGYRFTYCGYEVPKEIPSMHLWRRNVSRHLHVKSTKNAIV